MDIKSAQDWKNYYLQKALDLNTAEKNQKYYLQNYPKDLSPGGHLKLLHLWPGQIPPPGAVERVEL